MYIPVALGRISLVALTMTVTLNDVDCDSPVSTNVTFIDPLDSSAEYLDALNPTQATEIRKTPLNKKAFFYTCYTNTDIH